MKKSENVAICGIMISLALVLSYMERLIPLQMVIPLPGIKLGLANIVTLVALYYLGIKSAYTILIIRCILGAIFGGGISGLLFSLSGSLLALTIMILGSKVSFFSIFGISILGAAAHNIGQIIMAILLMKSIYIGGYLPYLLVIALFTGFATGSIAAGVLRVLVKTYKNTKKHIKMEEV